MRTLQVVAALFICCFTSLHAQVQTPQPSPHATIEQTVGLTTVTVDYSRPSKKGREIFGDLVPFGAIWRTGANANTIVTFSDDVMIADKIVKKGSYALYTKPGMEKWEYYLYSDTNNWGAPKEFDAEKIVCSGVADVITLPVEFETFTIGFNNLTNNGASLQLIWDRTLVSFDFQTKTREKAVASIEKTLNGPTARDYYSAASYYSEEGLDPKKAKEYIDEAIKMSGDDATYWMLRKQSLIYADAGDTKQAIKIAEKSLEKAVKAGNKDYIKMNEDSIAEWSKK